MIGMPGLVASRVNNDDEFDPVTGLPRMPDILGDDIPPSIAEPDVAAAPDDALRMISVSDAERPGMTIPDAPPEPLEQPAEESPIAPEMEQALSTAPPVGAPGTAPDLKPLPDITPTTVSAPAPMNAPPGARQKMSRVVDSPESLAVKTDAANLENAAVVARQNEASVNQAHMAEQAALATERRLESEQRQAEMDRTIRVAEERTNKALAQKEAIYNDLRATKFTDFWKERSTGDRVTGALAVFLGGLGGGENRALQILNKQIDSAHAKEEREIKQKWDLYGEASKNVQAAQLGKLNALDDLKLRKAASFDVAADKLEELKMRQGATAEMVKLDKDVVAIRQQGIPMRAEVAQSTRDRVEWDTWSNHKKSAGGASSGSGGGGKTGVLDAKVAAMVEGKAKDSEISTFLVENGASAKELKRLQAYAKQVRDGVAKDDKVGTTAVFGAGGVKIADAQTPKQADHLNEANEAYRNLRATLVDLRNHMEEHGVVAGVGPINSQEAARRKTMAGQITGLLKKQESLGTLDLGVERLVKSEIGGDLDLMTGRGKTKIDEVLSSLDRKQAATLEQKGLQGSGALLKSVRGDADPSVAPAKASTAEVTQSTPQGPSKKEKAAAANRIIQDSTAPKAKRDKARAFLLSLESN